MKKYIVLLMALLCFEGKLIAQNQAEPAASSKEEEMVLQLAADEVEDRDVAYKEIFKNPKAYLKYLSLAAKSDDPELKRHGEDLLFFAKAGIRQSMNPELIESIVNLKNSSEKIDDMSIILMEYTAKRSLKEDEYMAVINLYNSCGIPVSEREIVPFILQQSALAFKIPKISDKEPLKYVNYLLNKSSRHYALNKIVGCLFALEGNTSRTATSTDLVNSWRDVLLDPLANEGRIRGRHTTADVESTLDIALYRTDQLQRIFLEKRGDKMSPMRSLAYEWMNQSQLGKNPDRNEYLGKMMSLYFGMQTYPKDAMAIYDAALLLLGGIDDVEVIKKYGKWDPSIDPKMFSDLLGYPTLDCVKTYFYKLMKQIKKDPKNQSATFVYLCHLLSFLEGSEEFELIHQLCSELFPVLGKETLREFMSNIPSVYLLGLSPVLQCEFVDYSPDLADYFLGQVGLYADHFENAQGYKNVLSRLFGDLSPREQHQILLATQRDLPYWKEFLEKQMQALTAKLHAGSSYQIDDLCVLSEYLYITGREELAFALMSETKGASSDHCCIALYYTVLKLIEKGDISAAESFFKRYNQQIYSLKSSYYLAASEIEKAKKDMAKAEQYLTYAKVLYLFNTGAFGGDGGIFVANLLRGSYLQEAERMKHMFAFERAGLDNYARMGDMYLKRGDWHKARFYFECERYASLVRTDLFFSIPLLDYLLKSELAQAMLYMQQGEAAKATPHIDLCLKKLVCRPEAVEEILGVLCGPTAVATSEQKKQWRDRMLSSYQDLHKKYPRDPSSSKAIVYLKTLEPKTVSALVAKRVETDRSWTQAEPVRRWTASGEAVDGSICFKTPYIAQIRCVRDGFMGKFYFSDLSKEDVAYIKAWDPGHQIKEDYANLCAKKPGEITWLRDAVFGTQIAEVKKKPCMIVFMPAETSPEYKHFYPMLTGQGLRDLLGLDVVCILLTPEADGQWSPLNAQLLKQVAQKGDIKVNAPVIQCIKPEKTSSIFLQMKDCSEEDLLKLISAEFPPSPAKK